MSESIGQNGQGEQNACCSRVAAHLSHAHLIFEVEERSLVEESDYSLPNILQVCLPFRLVVGFYFLLMLLIMY